MKILLDENIDVRLKSFFPPGVHHVFTVKDMNWNGVKNGALLKLLKENNFDCWVVVDKNIPYQQNLTNLPCVIIVLDVIRNTLVNITPLLPDLLAALEETKENKVIVIPKLPNPS
jgi:hypothetical protein